MGVAFQAVGSLAQSGAATVTITAPTLVADDIMIAQVMETAGTHAITSIPAGWTNFHEVSISAGVCRGTLCWKRAVLADSGATFDFTAGGASQMSGVISAWRGCVTGVTPLDATAESVSTNAVSDSITYADYNPTESNAFVVAIGFYDQNNTTAGAISGTNPTFVNNYDLESATFSISFFCYSGASTGAATGARSHTTSSTTDAVNQGVMFGFVAAPTAVVGRGYQTIPVRRKDRFQALKFWFQGIPPADAAAASFPAARGWMDSRPRPVRRADATAYSVIGRIPPADIENPPARGYMVREYRQKPQPANSVYFVYNGIPPPDFVEVHEPFYNRMMMKIPVRLLRRAARTAYELTVSVTVPPPDASPVRFRKTLSEVGTGIGKRQKHIGEVGDTRDDDISPP